MTQAGISIKRDQVEAAGRYLAEVGAIYREMGIEDGTGELRSVEAQLGALS